MSKFKSYDKTLILGQSGCGKSYLGRIVQKIWPRRVIIDCLNEYSDYPKTDIYDDFGAIADRLAALERKKSKEYALVFQFDPEQKDTDAIFDQLIRVLYYMGNVLVVIEEIQEYCTPHKMPHWLRKSLLTGRHQNMALLFTTQRPALLNKTIVSQSAHIFCGRLNDKNDINYVSSFLNSESNKLAELKIRNFIYLNPEGITTFSTEKMALK